MQSLTILDQQDDEYGNTIKTQELWEITTGQGKTFYFL